MQSDPIAAALAAWELMTRREMTRDEKRELATLFRQQAARNRTEANKGRTRGYFHRLTRAGVTLDVSRADVPSARETCVWKDVRQFGAKRWGFPLLRGR